MNDAPQRILIIRPSALGDVCRSVPALSSLRRAFPDARIDWLVQDTFAGAVEHHPGLSSVVPFARHRFSRQIKGARPAEVTGWLRSLRKAGYDLVFDLQGLARSGFFAWCTRAARRVGYADARELGWLGLTERHAVGTGLHSVDRMLELLRKSGVEPVIDMRLYTSEQDRAWVKAEARLAHGSYAVIAPTSRWPGKRWPAERFAAVASSLLKMGLEAVAVVGAEKERDQCGPLLELAGRDARVLDLVGATGVGQLMALVESSKMVVANDSAALHMAVGFDRPIVALYGPTRVDLVGPYRREKDVIQHVTGADRLDHKDDGAGRALMDRIGVDEVVTACSARLLP